MLTQLIVFFNIFTAFIISTMGDFWRPFYAKRDIDSYRPDYNNDYYDDMNMDGKSPLAVSKYQC